MARKKAVKRRKGAAPSKRRAPGARRGPAAVSPEAPPPERALDLQPGAPPVPGDIPWGYGDDRVTALARDPAWVFVYWELTDEAIERARAEVQAPEAPCILRVYDTTYRLFDGTNANWYMDVPVHRPANNHYVCMDRPGSTFHVDIGVKSREGHFAKIARSAPVEMPRSEIAPDGRVEWMTVSAGGEPPPAYRHRFVPQPDAPMWRGSEPLAVTGDEAERIMRSLAGEGWSRTWAEPFWRERWRAIHPGTHWTVQIVYEGERRVIRTEHGERVVFGPWLVVIQQLDPREGQRIIGRWTIHYSWLSEGGTVRVETVPILRQILSGYRASVVPSGSEARLIRESWASESLHLGASEWPLPISSEVRR